MVDSFRSTKIGIYFGNDILLQMRMRFTRVFGVKKRSDFFYQGSVSGNPGQYSNKFIEWLIQQFNNDNDFFLKVRQKKKKIPKAHGKEGK